LRAAGLISPWQNAGAALPSSKSKARMRVMSSPG
jgi:hypothetical protein